MNYFVLEVREVKSIMISLLIRLSVVVDVGGGVLLELVLFKAVIFKLSRGVLQICHHPPAELLEHFGNHLSLLCT